MKVCTDYDVGMLELEETLDIIQVHPVPLHNYKNIGSERSVNLPKVTQ